MSKALVGLNDVAFNFRSSAAVFEKISFDLHKQETLAVVGPSGCGKTTLLSVIAGLRRQTHGSIAVDRRKIAAVFQDPLLLPWKTVSGNIFFGLMAQRKTIYQDLIQNLIAELGLEGFQKYFPHQLSRGMQQRVALARALILFPEVLLLDEPFSSLDEITRRVAQDITLHLIFERGLASILVTHNMGEALLFADRILILSSRPAHILKVVDVPFPKPRHQGLRMTSEFRYLEEELYQFVLKSP